MDEHKSSNAVSVLGNGRPLRIFRVLLALIVSVFISGCELAVLWALGGVASVPFRDCGEGQPFRAALESFEIGATTKAEAVEALGEPSRIYVWEQSEEEAPTEDFLYIDQGGLPCDTDNPDLEHFLMLSFSDQGVLEAIKRSREGRGVGPIDLASPLADAFTVPKSSIEFAHYVLTWPGARGGRCNPESRYWETREFFLEGTSGRRLTSLEQSLGSRNLALVYGPEFVGVARWGASTYNYYLEWKIEYSDIEAVSLQRRRALRCVVIDKYDGSYETLSLRASETFLEGGENLELRNLLEDRARLAQR